MLSTEAFQINYQQHEGMNVENFKNTRSYDKDSQISEFGIWMVTELRPDDSLLQKQATARNEEHQW